MYFHETTALGQVMGKPTLDQYKGKPCCKFVLHISAPGNAGPRITDIYCMVVGGNAGNCWGSIKEGDELTAIGIVYPEAILCGDGKPMARLCMRCNFVRYSQETLLRISPCAGQEIS